MKNFYSPKDLIKLLGFSKNTIYKYLEEGKIKSTRLRARGGYRVPAAEVERLLALHGKSENTGVVVEPTQGVSRSFQEKTEDILEKIKEPDGGIFHPRIEGRVPELFDWLAGLLAILVGFSLFLFPAYFYQEQFVWSVPYFAVGRFLLMFVGLLFLMSELSGRRDHLWHRAFHLLLGLAFGVFAYLYFKGGELRGIILYGAVAVVMLATVFGRVSHVVRFITAVYLVAGSGAVLAWLWPDTVRPLLFDPLPPFVTPWSTFGVATAIFGVSLVSIWRKNWWFAPASFVSGLIFLGFGFLTVLTGVWDRAVAYVLFGAFSFLFPFWRRFRYRERSGKQLLVTFLYLGVVLISGLLAMSLLRAGTEETIINQLEAQAEVVALQVEEFLGKSEKEVVALSQSPLFQEAVVEGNVESVDQIFRDTLRGSSSLRRLLLYDARGTVIWVYPESEIDIIGNDLSYRDYVQKALSGEVYITDLFQVTTGTNLWAVAIGAPIYSAGGELIGVLTGGVDYPALQYGLGSLRIGERGFVIVTDSAYRIVVHPNQDLVSSHYSAFEEMVGRGGQTARLSGAGGDRELVMAAEKTVLSHDWHVLAVKPMSEVNTRANGAALMVFLLMFGGSVAWLFIDTVIRKQDD